ncbi:MAG: GntR family transcriptional regulator [Candidatus Marinimicrobia bacterium]|nr:GntR family transcriptional regulator [Candidatus Neomarinimicrobiota bacterium]MCF7828904.1 GntR family transcriptional regulator [Candidatus Neomarinimicrobiota bacterium]MCF7879864.1 GntR family transcriptional regulator [Candidatus Neomarinimicrobiota bacterium]
MILDYSDPAPLYRQVAKSITRKINGKVFNEGDKIPSQRTLSEQYEVSMITIKRAISELINEGIVYSRKGKGTYVNGKLRKNKTRESKTIRLVLYDIKSPYFSMISHGVEMESSQQDYNLLLSNSSGEPEEEERLIHQSLDMGVDGLVIASMSHEYHANKTIRLLHESGFPYVIVSFIADKDIYQVGTDQRAGAYIATHHLIEHGYKEICYIKAEEGNTLGDIRYQGYYEAMMDAGLCVNQENCIFYPYSGEWNDYRSGYEIGLQFFERKRLPEAVFVYNDLGAIGFQEALKENGIRIPDDIAIMGFDGIERSAHVAPSLSTIGQPAEHIGQLAVDKLIKLIDGKTPKVRTILKPRLIIRESCGMHSDTESAHPQTNSII